LMVDWGDSSPVGSFNFLAGTTTFNVSHQYLNHGTFPASLTLKDDHTGTATGGLIVTVAAATPVSAFGLGGGSITEFPTLTPTSTPAEMTIGPDGNLWFTESAANKIGRITRMGVLTEFPVPTASSGLAQIATGPDGNLWFTENSASKIGQITPSGTITEFPL